MNFLDRSDELERLMRLSRSRAGGLAVVYGRRRVGKTRLLLEWVRTAGGSYSVADQSSADIQRRYFAETLESHLPGFAEVEYPDWRSLLNRLAREASRLGWRGPVVLDEVPYLVISSPEFPSVLQRWLDHEGREARLALAIAGSSQRMMQGLVLSRDAPIYGRATEILEINPLPPRYLEEVLPDMTTSEVAAAFAAFGGVPRYWELLVRERGSLASRIDRLVLDPLGTLHREPDRLLLEEIPSATELRPLLDAIGGGAHRLSEIAGRVGYAATSLSRPISRLVEMGLVRREIPFGEPEKKGKRSLYRIADPFIRLWFRVVSPHRAQLALATPAERRALLDRYWKALAAEGWEDLCRICLHEVSAIRPSGRAGSWGVASRWWRGNAPEWDLVACSMDGKHLLLGESKWSARPVAVSTLEALARELSAKPLPALPARYADCEIHRALFVPALKKPARSKGGIRIVTSKMLLR